jgi:Protein of unknown function (DUF2889)
VSAPSPRIPLHQRAYEIEAFLEDDDHLRLIGVLRDVKPDGLWGVDDPDPLTIHHMELHLLVRAADLTITGVEVSMHVHPEKECPLILAAYQQMVGWSIARGFTHKVREHFGGPRACTHIGALVNAMAPVAIQSLWAFFHHRNAVVGGAGVSDVGAIASGLSAVDRQAAMRLEMERNRDTCHVWASDGPMFELLDSGAEFVGEPLWAEARLAKLGIDADEWRRRRG